MTRRENDDAAGHKRSTSSDEHAQNDKGSLSSPLLFVSSSSRQHKRLVMATVAILNYHVNRIGFCAWKCA